MFVWYVVLKAVFISDLVDLFPCLQERSDRGKEIEYVMKRLIRGLASSRECARLGFSTVLTHVRLTGLPPQLRMHVAYPSRTLEFYTLHHTHTQY